MKTIDEIMKNNNTEKFFHDVLIRNSIVEAIEEMRSEIKKEIICIFPQPFQPIELSKGLEQIINLILKRIDGIEIK